jgi:hypothetical protein
MGLSSKLMSDEFFPYRNRNVAANVLRQCRDALRKEKIRGIRNFDYQPANAP